LARYADNFKLVRAYAGREGGFVGEFAPCTGSSLHLTFGTNRPLGTWFTVWQTSLTYIRDAVG
jgi:hypothetical protein